MTIHRDLKDSRLGVYRRLLEKPEVKKPQGQGWWAWLRLVVMPREGEGR